MINFKNGFFSGKKGKKPNKAENGKKVLSGMLFAAACFIAIFVLLEFHEVYWVVGIACAFLMGSAFWFLDSMFGDKDDIFDELAKAQEDMDRAKEEDRKKADDEFKKKIEEQVSSLDRTSRAMFAAMKRSADIQETHLSKMQIKIDKVIIDQNAGVKTMIKFNKENARQMALSEKATLEEIATRIPTSRRIEIAPEVPDDYDPDEYEPDEDIYEDEEENEAEPDDISIDAFESLLPSEEPVEEIVEAAEEEPIIDTEINIGEEAFLNEEPVIEGPGDEEVVIEEPVIEEETITEEEPIIEEEQPVFEAEPAEETTQENDEIPDLTDLFAEMASEEPQTEEPQTEESQTEEPAKEPEPSDPLAGLASSGVDLSDPNANLSADDIAKLFAAASNK